MRDWFWIAVLWAVVAVVAVGCNSRPALSPERAPWDFKCLGPRDRGRVLYWTGFSSPTVYRSSVYSRRYVCRDHGSRHGWWYEQAR